MTTWKLLFTGFFVLWGTVAFMRLIGQEVQNQRQELLAEKRRKEDRRRLEAMMIPVAKATPYESAEPPAD